MNHILSLYNLKAIVFIAFLLITSCSKDDPVNEGSSQNILVAFSISEEAALVDSVVQFTNESTGTDSNTTYSWDFGDDTSSTLKNPTHTYSELGDYIVKLTVKNGSFEKSVSKEIFISLSNTISGRKSLIETLNELSGRIMVCAHRANHIDAPENSLKSITDAIDNSIGMVELDIRQTRDGELVLMHDSTIDRTTNGSGKVSDFLLEELEQFNLYKKNGTLTNEKIPSLKEVLLLSRGKIFIDLDVKIESYAKIYTVINQYGMLGQVMFTVNNVTDGSTLISLNNESVVFPIVRNQSDYNDYVDANLNLSVMQFNSTALNNASLVETAKNAGISIFGNIYINTTTTPESDQYIQVDNFISLEGSIIQTDYPIKIKSYLKSKNLN